ncbi:MAG: hypothetical protein HY077_06930 [Elusimicrobia bacterium]|nr:hypothetical protein [Elusimicrobiota bacterium]
MRILSRALAALLSLALAAEPALAGGGLVEKPAPAPSAAPRPAPANPAGGLPRVELGATNLDPLATAGVGGTLAVPGSEAPTSGPASQQTPLPTALVNPAGVQIGAPVVPGASPEGIAPGLETPGAAGLTEALPAGKGEFGGLGRENKGGLEERVWEHAEERGFVRKSGPAEITGGVAAAPSLEKASRAPAEDPKGPPAPSKKEQLSVLSGKVLGFFSTFLLIQLAVESLALAVPQMTDPLKNGFIALAGLASTSYLAYAIGSFLGGRLVQRVGLARVYRTVLASRAFIWAGVAYIFHSHHGVMPIAPLIALFSLDYFVHSMGRVAERTLQGEWFKDSPVASNRFGTLRDFVEYGTVFTTMITGLLIATKGFGAVIYAAPFLFAGAAALAFALRSLPQMLSGRMRKVPLFAGFKRLFRPEMRPLFLARLLINNFVYLLYYVTGTAFGVFFAHGNMGMAAAAASALIGLLGMGANGAALTNAAVSRSIEESTESLPEKERPAAQSKLMSASAAKALRWAALTMLSGWLFVSQVSIGTVAGPVMAAAPFIGIAGLVGLAALGIWAWRKGQFASKTTLLKSLKWIALAAIGGGVLLAKAHVASWLIWPLFAVSPALILIGYTGQVALTQLDTLLLDRMPKRTKAYVVGADRTLTNLSYVVNFMVWGILFQLFGSAAFIGLGIYCTLTAAGYFLLSRRVAPPQNK